MAAKFSMSDLLNSQSKTTPEREQAGQFEVKNIPIEQIVPSENNKYGIRDIEELAASIETMGLLHNLVVKEANAEGMYELVSGERRFRACKLLYDGGYKGFATVPCKVEGNEDKAISELKLIYANATARELTDYEKTYQAGRIKELLQQLKDSGYKFKGRMREIVADMLNVSPAQMGRMESINKNLAPEFKEEFKSGNIGITTAYELSTLPQEQQAATMGEYKEQGTEAVKNVKEKKPNARETLRDRYENQNCKFGGKCTNAENLSTFLKGGNIEGCAGCCWMCIKKDECALVCEACKPATTYPLPLPVPVTEPPERSPHEPQPEQAQAQDQERVINRTETIRLLHAIATYFENGNDGSGYDIRGVCLDAAALLEDLERG